MGVYHIGVDLHKDFSQVTAMDNAGNILSKRSLEYIWGE